MRKVADSNQGQKIELIMRGKCDTVGLKKATASLGQPICMVERCSTCEFERVCGCDYKGSEATFPRLEHTDMARQGASQCEGTMPIEVHTV